MRAIVGTLCVALLFCSSSARTQSAHELLQACEGLERTKTFVGDNISCPRRQTNEECWYFMSAVQRVLHLGSPWGAKAFLGACTEPTITLSQSSFAPSTQLCAFPSSVPQTRQLR